MSIKLELPKLTDLKPRITVVGVGGAGGNAINNMIAAGLDGVDFVVANTDAQALATSSAEHRIQLGTNLTEGLGAGSKPEIGEAAAEEAIDEIKSQIYGTHMLFVAAGMGGGTGTGAASVIARTARDLGILTVAVVTKPFQFEGSRRLRIAEAGIAELKKHVDTLIVIPNQNLFRIANEKTTFAEAFVLADQVLYSGIACIVDLIVKEGLINLDLADVRTVLTGMGTAMMGTGEASGERRAILAAEEAIANPLLDDISLRGAKGLLLSIIGGRNLTLYEVDEAASRVRQEVDPDANIIVGATFDDNLGERVRVSIVASGMGRAEEMANPPRAGQTLAAGGPNVPPQGWPALSPARNGAGGPPPLPFGHSAAPASQFPPGAPPQLRNPHAPQGPPATGKFATDFNAKGAPGTATSGAATKPGGQKSATWRGPGDVIIEERPPQVVDQIAAGEASAARRPAESGYATEQDAFTPQHPSEVRRGQRRLPELDDFPPVGQREFRAKSQQAVDRERAGETPLVYQGAAPPSPKKGSLLQRLVGSSRSRESAAEPVKDGKPQAELPEFFGRQKRSS